MGRVGKRLVGGWKKRCIPVDTGVVQASRGVLDGKLPELQPVGQAWPKPIPPVLQA